MAKKKNEPVAPREFDIYEPAMPLELIDPAPDNPRRELGDLTELAESMKGPAGIVQPLLITPRGERYLTVAGHRRRGAAVLAGLTTAPVLIRKMDETTRKTIMLVENLQRVDLSPLEEARSYRELVALGWAQRRIATDVGRSQSHIAKRLSLLELPDEVTARIDSGGITVGDALELVKLKDHREALERVVKDAERGLPIDYQTQRALQEIESRAQLAARVRALEGEGYRVLVSDTSWQFRCPEGVVALGDNWRELPLDPIEHAREPCHAFGIFDCEHDPVPLCTDRARHPDVMTLEEQQHGNAAEAEAERAAHAEQRRADKADDARRDAFVLGLLKRKVVRRDEALAYIARAIVLDEHFDEDELQAWATELGVPFEDGLALEALDAYIRRAKPDALIQLMLVASLRWTAFYGYADRDGDLARRLDVLAPYGYVASERERERATPAADEADDSEDEAA